MTGVVVGQRPGPAAQPQAVGHDEDAGQRHRAAGDHRVEQAGRRERDRRHVVAERPAEVLLDDPQRRRDSPIASPTAPSSARSSTMSADSIATSVPDPIAMPRSAWASAAASLTPSPTMATTLPSRLQARDRRVLVLRAARRRGRGRVDADLARRPRGRSRSLSPVSRYAVSPRSPGQRRRRRAAEVRPHRVGDGERGAGDAAPADVDRACRSLAEPRRCSSGTRSNRSALPTVTSVSLIVARAPGPGSATKPVASRDARARARGRPATTAWAIGCSLPASTAAAARSAAVPVSAPAVVTSTRRSGAGGDGAGLVEHDGVDPAGALQDLRALDQDAELGPAAGADQQGGRGRQPQGAGAGDDRARRRRGDRAAVTSSPVQQPPGERQQRDDRGRPARTPRTPGRPAAGPAPCRSGPARPAGSTAARVVSAPTRRASTTRRPLRVDGAAGDLVARSDLDRHRLAGDQAAVDRAAAPSTTTPSVAIFSPGARRSGRPPRARRSAPAARWWPGWSGRSAVRRRPWRPAPAGR